MQDLETWSDTNTITHTHIYIYAYIYLYTYIYINTCIHTQVYTNETNAFQSNEGYPGSMRFQRFILAIFSIGFEEFSFYDGHWKVKCKAREVELETTKNQMNLL